MRAIHAQMQASLQNPAIAKFYVNSVSMAMTPNDLILSLVWNGMFLANVSMTYMFAKSLGEDLTNAVKEYESATGIEIPSLKSAMEAMAQSKGTPG
jgi:hypothetical protein